MMHLMGQKPVMLWIGILLLLAACANLENERAQVLLDSEAPTEMEIHELMTPVSTNTAVATQISTASPAPVATSTPLPTPSLTPTSTVTSTPTSTPPPSATPTDTAVPTEQPTETPIPQPGIIVGQILLNGAPPAQPMTIILEDQNYQVVQEISAESGIYRFDNLVASLEGYNVLFTQASNPHFDTQEVVSWAWIGPIPVQDGDYYLLPHLEIAPFGLVPLSPMDGAIINTDSISSANPLTFDWTAYPGGAQYWMELRAGPALQMVWQSDFVIDPSVAFDGVLINGEPIQAGNYWWSVGVRLDDPRINITGPLAGFTLRP
jgi:hypothetical protein